MDVDRQGSAQGSIWGELPDSVLNMLLTKAAPVNREAVNLVNKRWHNQHALAVHHLAPRVWDPVWLGLKFPLLESLILEETSRRHHQADQPGRVSAGDAPVHVVDDDLLGLATLTGLKALALKSSPAVPSQSLLTSVGMSVLAAHLTALEALRLDRCHLTGLAIEALSRISTLKCLHLKELSNCDRHLGSLGRLTSLTSLYLEGCRIGDTGVEALTSLSSLRILCISSARSPETDWEVRVTDAGLKCLEALPQLQALDLDCCNNIEGHGLTGLTGLDSLGLSKLKGFTREAMGACMATLTRLTGLDLLDCPHLLTHQGMQLWTQPTTVLRSLRLCRMLANDAPGHIFLLEPAFLAQCPNLTDLDLGQSSFIHSGTVLRLANLVFEGFMTSLRTLWLSAADIEEEHPLMIGQSQLTDDGLAHLARLSNLRSLCLSYNRSITCIGLSFLVASPDENVHLMPSPEGGSGLCGLEELDLTGCDHVADMGVSWLALHLTNLQVLSLSECPVTDMCLPFFSRLGSLRELSLRGCHYISDVGLLHLARLTSLQELHLGWCCELSLDGLGGDQAPRITATGLQHIAGLAALTVLSLEGCLHVTAEAAKHLLARCTSLVALDLRNTHVPETFFEDMVRPLLLTRRLNVKVGMRAVIESTSDVFDLIARPVYKHCVNPAHDWTGACHEQPCACSELWKLPGSPPT